MSPPEGHTHGDGVYKFTWEHKVGKDPASMVGHTANAHTNERWDSWESSGPRVMLQSSLT